MRVSKLAILSVACLSITSVAGAQIRQNETVLLGGLVSSTFGGDDVGNVSRKTGLMAEVQLTVPFTPNIGLQTGVGVIQKGASLSLGGGTTDKSKLNLSYFEVPATLRISFAGRYSQVRPAFFLGPIASLNVGCTTNIATQGGGNVQSECDPDGPQIRAFDVALAGGGSVEFGNFGAFVRYDHGLVSIDTSDDADKVFNRAIVLGVIWNSSNR